MNNTSTPSFSLRDPADRPAAVTAVLWLKKNNFKIIATAKTDDNEMCILSSGHAGVYLIYVFDHPGKWIAEEIIHAEDSMPYWIASDQWKLSPAYRAKSIAAYLMQPRVPVYPIVILGKELRLINEMNMLDTWERSAVRVCCCPARQQQTCFINDFTDEIQHLEYNNPARLPDEKQILHFRNKFAQIRYLAGSPYTRYKRSKLQPTIREQLNQVNTSSGMLHLFLAFRYPYLFSLRNYLDPENGDAFSLICDFRRIFVMLKNKTEAGDRVYDPVRALERICRKLYASGTKLPLYPCVVNAYTRQAAMSVPEKVSIDLPAIQECIIFGNELYHLMPEEYDKLFPEPVLAANTAAEEVRRLLRLADQNFTMMQDDYSTINPPAPKDLSGNDPEFEQELLELEKHLLDRKGIILPAPPFVPGRSRGIFFPESDLAFMIRRETAESPLEPEKRHAWMKLYLHDHLNDMDSVPRDMNARTFVVCDEGLLPDDPDQDLYETPQVIYLRRKGFGKQILRIIRSHIQL